MSDYPDLLVLGAGPCGLAAAFHAKQAGLHVQLLDAADAPGGRMRSSIEHLNGKELVIEHGPVGWAGPAPEAEAACLALGLEPIASAAADSHRYLVHRDQLVPFPQSIAAMSASKLLSVREKLRVAAEKWADFAPEGKEETVHEFFARRFGDAFATKIVGPVVRGLFADDPRTASLHALLPGIAAAELEHGSLSKALKRQPGLFGASVRSLPRGLSQLADALVKPLADDYKPSCRVDSAVREQGWWFLFHEGQQVAVGRQLAVCLPAQQAGMVLREYLPRGLDSLARFCGPDLASVSVLHRIDSLPDACAGFGILPPIDHTSPVLNVQFAHSIFPQHVPEGWALLRGMLGGDADPQILQRSDAELVDILNDDLHRWVGAPLQPERSWVYRIPGGVPHYGLGYQASRDALLEDLAPVQSLHLGGDAWFGIGIDAALTRGAAIAKSAQRVHSTLQSS
jgi:protoporphyrinogen/coproporphyrinogen III oxidase